MIGLGPEQRAHAVRVALAGNPHLVRVLAEDASRSLAAFVQQLWPVLEPGTPLEWAWHLDLLCRELELVSAGVTRDLLICIPPGFMKSMLVGVFWPAWWWLSSPGMRYLTLSSSDDIAIRDSWRMRQIVNSPWYRRLIEETCRRRGEPGAWSLAKDQNTKVNFVNTCMGQRLCMSTGGSVTGERGNGMIIDDPHQVKDVLGSPEQVAAALDRAHRKVEVALPSRVNDHRTSWRVTVMQRLHEDDVAGRQLKDPAVRHVVLPMHAFDLDDPLRHPEDPRAPGELLDPVRMPEVEVRRLAAKLEQVPGQARAQLEQRPINPQGGMIQRAWTTQRYTWDPQRPPVAYDEVVLTVDATFKLTRKGSYVSIQAWARRGWTARYLLDEVHARMGYVAFRAALRDMARKWRPNAVLVEEKANGAAVLDDLRGEVPGLIAFAPDRFGDKMARAQLATPTWQSTGVWLPSSEVAPWVGDYVNDLAAFPATLAQDRVDAMSQLFLWWHERRSSEGTEDAFEQGLAALLEQF